MIKRIRKTGFIAVQLLALLTENIIWDRGFMTDASLQYRSAAASVMIAVNIIIQVIGLLSEKKLCSFGGFFILLSYPVHCSYAVLLGLGAVPADSVILTVHMLRHGAFNYIRATRFSVNSIAAVFIGYMAVSKEKGPVNDNGIVLERNTALFMKNCGIITAAVFGAVYYASTLYAIASVLGTASYSGFAEIKGNTLFGIALALQPFYFSALFMLAVYFKSSGRKNMTVFIMLTALFSVYLSFLTGSRIRGTMILLVIFILWVNTAGPLTGKSAVFCIAAALFTVLTFIAVRMTRNSGFSLPSLINAYTNIENNIFYEAMSEFGVSVFTTAGFMNLGLSGRWWEFAVKEIGSVLPRISHWGGDIFAAPSVRTGFESMYSLGTTYIADLYFYFGRAGQYAAAFYGMFIAALDNMTEKWRDRNKYIAICTAIPGIYSVFSSVRAPATLGIKLFLYSRLIYGVFALILIRRRKSEV